MYLDTSQTIKKLINKKKLPISCNLKNKELLKKKKNIRKLIKVISGRATSMPLNPLYILKPEKTSIPKDNL